MFPIKKMSYVLYRKTETGRIEAVGSFLRSELQQARIDFEMPEAKAMEEEAFRKKYPKIYKRIFMDYWHIFLGTFLYTLDFLDHDNEEVIYDDANQMYYSNWFTILQDIDNEKRIVFDHHVAADEKRVIELIVALNQYLINKMEFHVNPPCYISQLEENKIYYGKEIATQRMMAENAMLTNILN